MKKTAIFALILSAFLLLSGCFSPIIITDNYSYPKESSESKSTSIPSVSLSPDESEIYAESDVSDITEITKISSLTELRDYLNGNKAQDIFELRFEYDGELDGETIARISNACCINWRVENGNEYYVTVFEYPGERMIDAHLSGDTSGLDEDELRTLEAAKQIVEEAKEITENDFELELLLHDAIMKNVVYYGGPTAVDDPENPPRHLTAVGALLDGSANCQGYSDAFYLLATLAGFTVGRMNVYNSDGWHMANTILLDGAWYIVDVTFDDTVIYTDGVQPSYRFFNAGRDMCVEYEWGAEFEYYPIADETDENYFYYYNDSESFYGYEKVFTDIDVMAQHLVDLWLYSGRSELHTVIQNGIYDWTDLQAAFNRADSDSAAFGYTIWTFNNGIDTFFLVRFY